MYADGECPVERPFLVAMSDAIAHRGPDADGFWQESGIALVHRRLSVIDLTGGNQPIANEDGSLQVVFNGEIYNYHALRAGLLARGHQLRTHSDTEVIVHLYEEAGPRLVEQLRGMFAFALWDRPRRRLLLARDRVGIKPLYYYRDAQKLVFGSELKAILAHPGVDTGLDPAALEDYITYGFVPGPRTIFRKIEKLPPGHFLAVEPERLDASPQRYWQLRIEPDESLTADAWQEAVAAKLDETVRAHLIADVPVGAFLSGGLDSSLVVALASSAYGAEHPAGPLQTFSIGFHEEMFSELSYARQVAAQVGARHLEEIVTANAVDLLEELTRFYDEPFADASAVPTYLVSRLASRHVKVVLSGDGGDEAFGGYARYAHDLREAALRQWLPGWLRHGLLLHLGAVWPKADWLPRPLRLKTALVNLGLEPGSAYANTLAVCRPPLRHRLLAAGVVAQLDGHRAEATIEAAHAKAPAGDALAGMLQADVETVLPDDFLVKVDRASMAHGLEVRPPLLDHEFLELTARIPSRFKVHHGQTKWILKKVARSQLPAAIIDRPKHGFDVPVDAWLRGSLRPMFESAVFDPRSPVADLLDQVAVRRLYAAHCRGQSHAGGVLWSLLVLARWSERYLRSPRLP